MKPTFALVLLTLLSCTRHPEGSLEVELKTADGVLLKADLLRAAGEKPPGIVLLHMLPPRNTRSNFRPAFVEGLAARGFTVLNVDRRGAGASQGAPADAYQGPKGVNDAKAAVDFLVSAGCDPNRIAFVAASNGTTTMVDYASEVPAARRPRALVYLSGGDYTENQHALRGNAALLQTPSLFLFSTEDRLWNTMQQGFASKQWEFAEYPEGHGTALLKADGVDAWVGDFLAAHLKP